MLCSHLRILRSVRLYQNLRRAGCHVRIGVFWGSHTLPHSNPYGPGFEADHPLIKIGSFRSNRFWPPRGQKGSVFWLNHHFRFHRECVQWLEEKSSFAAQHSFYHPTTPYYAVYLYVYFVLRSSCVHFSSMYFIFMGESSTPIDRGQFDKDGCYWEAGSQYEPGSGVLISLSLGTIGSKPVPKRNDRSKSVPKVSTPLSTVLWPGNISQWWYSL